MPVGSGISFQLGFGDEGATYSGGSAVGVTPDHFAEVNPGESMAFDPTWIDVMAMKSGRTVKPAAGMLQSRYQAGGGFSLPFAYKGLGLLLRQMLGSSVTAPTLVSGSAYKQVHQVGDPSAKSLTLQLGEPQTDGTVKPFTYPGAMFLSWELTIPDNGPVGLSFTVDARNEVTSVALASAVYTNTGANAGFFVFRDVGANSGPGLKLGGTASTTTGVVSIASGVAATTIFNSFTLRGTNALANSRFGLGNAGAKAKPVISDLVALSGTLVGEFTSQSEIYDVFKAQTTTALQLQATGSLISGGNYNFLDIVLPAVKYKAAGPTTADYGVTQQTVNFDVGDDGTNNPCQITLQSTDSSL